MGLFGSGPQFDATKLKTNLRVCSQRLQVLQKKKESLNVQARKEIASLLALGKDDSACIKTELIIREDNTIEAMEMLDLFCNTLLARIGMITQFMYCDDSILEPVATIMWAAPRMPQEAKELMLVRDLLTAKYGPEFAAAVMENRDNCVSEKVMKKLDVRPPPKKLVNLYMEEIARAHNVTWVAKPDSPPPAALDLDDLERSEEKSAAVDAEPPASTDAPPPYLFKFEEGAPVDPSAPPPQPPAETHTQAPSDDDFEDLAARFQRLKKD